MRSRLTVILFAIAYIVVGIVTADFAASAASTRGAWRLAAWGASLALYVAQLVIERVRFRNTSLSSALHTSAAVAIAAFALAIAGPLRAHWGAPDQARAVMAVVLWPVLAGLPAFVLGLGAAAVIGRVFGPGQSR